VEEVWMMGGKRGFQSGDFILPSSDV